MVAAAVPGGVPAGPQAGDHQGAGAGRLEGLLEQPPLALSGRAVGVRHRRRRSRDGVVCRQGIPDQRSRVYQFGFHLSSRRGRGEGGCKEAFYLPTKKLIGFAHAGWERDDNGMRSWYRGGGMGAPRPERYRFRVQRPGLACPVSRDEMRQKKKKKTLICRCPWLEPGACQIMSAHNCGAHSTFAKMVMVGPNHEHCWSLNQVTSQVNASSHVTFFFASDTCIVCKGEVHP